MLLNAPCVSTASKAESHAESPSGALETGEIRVERLTVRYGHEIVLDDIDGRFKAGSMTAIVGPNGAGKSTLVRTIMGLVKPASGRIILGGGSATGMAYLPQAADVDRAFPITVIDMVLLGGWHRIGATRAVDRQISEAAHGALIAVGMNAFGDRAIGSLSAGQFQRVLFARLLLQDASVIVLDEPFTAIDARTRDDLLQLLLAWQADGRTVIAVLHDHEDVRAHFPEVLILARQQCGWGPTRETLTAEKLMRANSAAQGWTDSG